uniref:hypothetical protein n=1 Tax=Nocardia araoensis TaxID=228600 RepID=UPI0012F6B794
CTELHVRYGERDGLYLDWAITVVLRRGGLGEYLTSGATSLERRRMRRYEVSEAGIRRITYDPMRSPTAEILRTLYAGDEEIIDQGYDEVMTQLSQSWNARYPEPDPHTVATFGFASLNRRPEFRASVPNLTSTLVAIDPDVAEEVWVERGNAYFDRQSRSAAVWMPDREQWRFLFTGSHANESADGEGSQPESLGVPALQSTMGMLADLVNRGSDWPEESL